MFDGIKLWWRTREQKAAQSNMKAYVQRAAAARPPVSNLSEIVAPDPQVEPSLDLGCGKITHVAASRDGRWLATSDDYQARVWSTEGEFRIHWQLVDRSIIQSCALSNDGSLLAVGLWQKIDVYCLRNKKLVVSIPIEDNTHADSIAFGLDPNLLVAVAGRRSIYIWDIRSKEFIKGGRLAKDYTSGVLSVSVSHDDKHVLEAGTLLRLWSVSTGKDVRTFDAIDPIFWKLGTFRKSGSEVLALGRLKDKLLCAIFAVSSGELLVRHEFEPEVSKPVQFSHGEWRSISEDGAFCALTWSHEIGGGRIHEVVVIDSKTGKRLALSWPSSYCFQGTFLRNDSLLALGTETGLLEIIIKPAKAHSP